MKSRTEKVITDVYGDPDYLMPVHAFTKLTGNLNPPLLGDYIIEYENTPDCSKYQDIWTSGCNVYAKYSDVSMPKGNRPLHSQRLYPGQNYVYEDGKCKVDITFNSGEASAYPDCTDQSCFGPQSFSDFTIHIKKIGETKPTPTPPPTLAPTPPPTPPPTLAPTPPPQNPVEKYALIIGIDKYVDKPLKGCVNDANAIYNLLVNGYGYSPSNEHIVTLIDGEATQTSITDKLIEFYGKVDSNDIFVFFFSGHGGRNSRGEEYICPVNIGKYWSNALSSSVLGRLIDAYDGTVIAIFDSCNSGGMALETDTCTPSGSKKGIDRDNAVVLMACEAEEDSYVKYLENQYHGVFTYYLYKAFVSDRIKSDIDYRDGQVSVEEAFNYAAPKTVEKTSWDLTWGVSNPLMMDHYLTKYACRAPCYLSEEPINPEFIAGEGNCPIHLHAYDSEGRHTGITAAGDGTEEEIPGSFYNGPEYDPEEIIVLGKSDNIIYRIEALDSGSFNFTITKSTEAETKKITYLDVPITETTEATVAVSTANQAYTMEIDNDGDGITDYTNEPDSIETIGGVSETKTCKVQITTNPSLQDRPSIVHVNGNYYIAYQSHEKGYGIYIKEFDSNWKFKKKVEVASGSAYYDSPSLLFANNKLYVAYITNANGANANDYDVIVKEYNPSSLSCTKGAKYLTSLQSCQDLPALYYKDGYFYLAYQSWEKGDGDIFIKKFDSNLNMLTKVQVTTKSSLQDRPSITYANGYFYVAYFSEETGYYDIFVKRLDSNLNLASWKEQITTKSSYQSYPFITFVNNQFVISYASTEFGTLGIYMKKYDSHWNFIEKTEVIDSSAYERRPSHIWDGSNFWVAYVYNQGDSQDWNIFAIRPDSECGSVHCRGLE